MGSALVAHDRNQCGVGIMDVDQRTHLLDKISGRALGRDGNIALAAQQLDVQEHVVVILAPYGRLQTTTITAKRRFDYEKKRYCFIL